MSGWLTSTCETILEHESTSILEIGCGLGLLLFRIAPYSDCYIAADISREALNYVENELRNTTHVESANPLASNGCG